MRGFVVVLAAAVLGMAGCSSGSDSDSAADESPAGTATRSGATTSEQPGGTGSERVYARRELPRLALQPADAPRGMRYTKAESGQKTFLDVGLIIERELREVRRLGLRAIYDVIFDSKRSDLRLTSRLWLFEKPRGARAWLTKTASDAVAFQLERVSAPRLADGSWAARGNVAGSEIITHAFRAGNVVVVVSFSTQSLMPSESDALAATKKAVTRIRPR